MFSYYIIRDLATNRITTGLLRRNYSLDTTLVMFSSSCQVTQKTQSQTRFRDGRLHPSWDRQWVIDFFFFRLFDNDFTDMYILDFGFCPYIKSNSYTAPFLSVPPLSPPCYPRTLLSLLFPSLPSSFPPSRGHTQLKSFREQFLLLLFFMLYT